MVEEIESRTGYFTLNWQDESRDELVKDCFYKLNDSNGLIIYRGRSSSSFISGKENGEYNYSVFSECPNSSITKINDFSVRVNHYSKNIAFSFFGIGFLAFIVLCAVIIKESIKGT